MRSLYVTSLRTVVIAAMLATAVQVMLQTRNPMWVEDTYEFGPAACNQAPDLGRIRFNTCANLDNSRFFTR